MGNFEKLVVLTVLFLSAIVLAVSLSSGGDEDEGAANPLLAAEKSTSATASREKPAPGPKRPVLSAEGTQKPERKTPQPKPQEKAGGEKADTPKPKLDAQGRPWVLRNRAGLERSPLADYMLYTCVEGDTWSGLAERFYASGTFASLLRAANEDVEAPKAGEALLVPVYDFRTVKSGRTPVGPAPRRTTEPAPAEEPLVKNGVYVVKDGDTLSEIAQAIYGSSAKWKDIYDANRDVLESPDWLDVGTPLKIP